MPEGGASSLDRLALAAKAEETFLALLRLFEEQGQTVSSATGANYAPAVFARHSKAAGIGRGHFAAAMQDLLDKKMVRIEVSGPPSRQRQRLVCSGG